MLCNKFFILFIYFLFVLDYTIPKGWTVTIWTRAIHMDPQMYSNPQEFDPSRWDVCFFFFLMIIHTQFIKINPHMIIKSKLNKDMQLIFMLKYDIA